MKVLIVGNFRFGSGAANALRVRGITRALYEEGHVVSILDEGRPHERVPLTADADVTTVHEYESGLLSFLPAGVRGLFLGDVAAARVRAEGWKPDCIILYGTHLGYLLRFHRLCRELRIPLVLDVVEWYQPEDLPGGRFGPYAVANEISMRYASHRADGFIVLSRRLENHYRRDGAPVINIPPLFEPESAVARKASGAGGRLHLCYAGSPGRKEAFGLILSALQQVADRGVDFVLHAVGMTAADLGAVRGMANLGICTPAHDRIRFYGRVPNDQARRIVAEADFTLLLRPLRKANQFGFPSKLAESMAVGTPVIANDFSDLGQHLVDGENAIFLPELDEDRVLAAIMRAAAMSADQKVMMGRRALELAARRFSPRAASEPLSRFLGALV